MYKGENQIIIWKLYDHKVQSLKTSLVRQSYVLWLMDGEIEDVHNNGACHLESDSEFQQNPLSKDSEKCMIPFRNFHIPKFYFLSFRGKALYASKCLTILDSYSYYY